MVKLPLSQSQQQKIPLIGGGRGRGTAGSGVGGGTSLSYHSLAKEGQWQLLFESLLAYQNNHNNATNTNDNAVSPENDATSENDDNNPSSPALLIQQKQQEQELLTSQGPQLWTPLMLSCARAPPEVIALLIKCSPKSVTVADRSGSLPLHFVCSWRRGRDDLTGTSTAGGRGNGEEASGAASATEDNDSQDKNEEEDKEQEHQQQLQQQQYYLLIVIKMLINIHPATISAQNQWGQTPLHCLFTGKVMPSFEAVQAFFSASTMTTSMTPPGVHSSNDSFSNTTHSTPSPIPTILNDMSKTPIIKNTTTNYTSPSDSPNNTNSTNNLNQDHDNGNHPQQQQQQQSYDHHYAPVTQQQRQIQRQIRKHTRAALSTLDCKSRMPLHIAASRGASVEILRLLVSVYPEAAATVVLTRPPAQSADKNDDNDDDNSSGIPGDLPIHLLCAWGEDAAKCMSDDDYINSATSGSDNSYSSNGIMSGSSGTSDYQKGSDDVNKNVDIDIRIRKKEDTVVNREYTLKTNSVQTHHDRMVKELAQTTKSLLSGTFKLKKTNPSWRATSGSNGYEDSSTNPNPSAAQSQHSNRLKGSTTNGTNTKLSSSNRPKSKYSKIHNYSKSKLFRAVSVEQVEALLEPLCIGFPLPSPPPLWLSSSSTSGTIISSSTNTNNTTNTGTTTTAIGQNQNQNQKAQGTEVGTILGTDAVGMKENGKMISISERGESDTEKTTTSLDPDSTQTGTTMAGTGTGAIFGDRSTIYNSSSAIPFVKSLASFSSSKASTTQTLVPSYITTACMAFGSRRERRVLPIHIAAEHGVSFAILSALCQQYPEGVKTPALVPMPILSSPSSTPSSAYQSFGSNQKHHSFGKNDDNASTDKEKMASIYAIELFEIGRAGIDAKKAAHMRKRHILNPNNHVLTNTTFASSSVNMDKIVSVLKGFDERSDLLFGYYPEAIPSDYKSNTTTTSTRRTSQLLRSKNRNGKKTAILYRKDPNRLRRLENLIRNEATDHQVTRVSTTTRLIWIWFCKQLEISGSRGEKGVYQASIGRIISGLSDSALWKLDRIALNKSSSVLSGATPGIDGADSDGYIYRYECCINGRTIKEEASLRAPTLTMDQMLNLNKSDGGTWFGRVLDFLSGHDGLNYSRMCRRTRLTGLQLSPEIKLEESGRTWNLPPREDIKEFQKSELWQDLDTHISKSAHTVYVTYYLEVSEPKRVTSLFSQRNSPLNKSGLGGRKGGLFIASKDMQAKKLEEKVEAVEQQVLTTSTVSALEGCEVSLCFRHKRNRLYSLRVFGPFFGGRVSVSNARIRQLLYVVDKGGESHFQAQSKKDHLPQNDSISISTSTFDSSGSMILHNALRSGASSEVLSTLITSNPASLLQLDNDGRTPLHVVFLLPAEEPPSLSTIKALLTTPGENATKLKDSTVRLPLHIAAERGANEAILRLLVDAYGDGCYRLNKDGDLPVHLLARSGRATTASIELLLRPIMDNETICKIPGSQGVELPLHIAANFNCSYKVLESLLLTYGEGASIARQRRILKELPLFPLDIIEHIRGSCIGQKTSDGGSSNSERNSNTLFRNSRSGRAREAAKIDMEEADFNLRSDLIFVYNPTIKMGRSSDSTPIIYRKDHNRIKRLQNLIRREAIERAKSCDADKKGHISQMAQLGWCFLCIFKNPESPNDHYAEAVASILRGLPKSAVHVLAEVTYPFSKPIPFMTVTDCAIPICRQLILSRIQFVGRYILDESDSIIHKSDGCLVLGARDYGAVDIYKRIMSLFNADEVTDVDELSSVATGTFSAINNTTGTEDPIILFEEFVNKLGFDEESARMSLDRINALQNEGEITTFENNQRFNEGSHKSSGLKRKTLSQEAFKTFCSFNKINQHGVRSVIIKFMKNRSHFQREKLARIKLNMGAQNFAVMPLIDDYDVDRISDHSESGRSAHENQTKLLDSKDSLYLFDIEEKNTLEQNFSLYKYAIVMPRGDKDLADIVLHNDSSILKIRQYMLQIGIALRQLHNNNVVHGDLGLSNVVRYSNDLSLIDLDSASVLNEESLPEGLVGLSQKFRSGNLPPELISKIDVRKESDKIKNYQEYWQDISSDWEALRKLNADEFCALSNLVLSLNVRPKIAPIDKNITSLRTSMISISDGINDPFEKFKETLSQSLGDNFFDSLSPSLQACTSVEDFSEIWERLQMNALLWEKVRPRMSSDRQYAYIVKILDDTRGPSDGSSNALLPYEPVSPSEKSDIWAFGTLLFFMISGVTLFHVTFNGQLCNTSAFEDLYNWNNKTAKTRISSFIDDPLAQDLLLRLLAVEDDRLDSMDLVLKHPFFSLVSTDDVHSVLKEYKSSCDTVDTKKEELELAPQRFLSMEKSCRISFDRKEAIPVPTSFVLLPYKLEMTGSGFMEAPNNISCLAVGEKIGKHLLEINVITAKLSFWLKMKEVLSDNNGIEYRMKIKTWLQRALKERTQDIAKEMITSIGYDEGYLGICVEMLQEGMNISHARDFIKNPLGAAGTLIRKQTKALFQCYPAFKRHMLYLIDDYDGTIATSEDQTGCLNDAYSIELSRHTFENTLLPFMNLMVMTITAIHGIEGLARLLGLPSSFGVPDSWKNLDIGLVHKAKTSGRSTIVEFATLQRILIDTKREKKSRKKEDHQDSGAIEGDGSDSIRQLEAFFRKIDPKQNFSGLNRMHDSEDDTMIFWTTHEGNSLKKTPVGPDNGVHELKARLHTLQKEIEAKKKLEEEAALLLKSKLEKGHTKMDPPAEDSSNASNVRGGYAFDAVYPSSSQSHVTSTTKQTFESMSTPTGYTISQFKPYSNETATYLEFSKCVTK